MRMFKLRLLAWALLLGNSLPAADIMDSYEWKPICLGAGGWGEGIVCSETDPNVRFMRTDTGQLYRWSAKDNFWLPMIVQHDDGSGFGKDIFPDTVHATSSQDGHIALDPNDNNVVYLYFHTLSYAMNRFYGTLPYNVYKSTDGGKNFKATHFNAVAKFTLKHDDEFCPPLDFTSLHQNGGLMAVDPNNSKVVYIGTGTNGVFKSVDGGETWKRWAGAGLPAVRGGNLINVLPCLIHITIE